MHKVVNPYCIYTGFARFLSWGCQKTIWYTQIGLCSKNLYWWLYPHSTSKNFFWSQKTCISRPNCTMSLSLFVDLFMTYFYPLTAEMKIFSTCKYCANNSWLYLLVTTFFSRHYFIHIIQLMQYQLSSKSLLSFFWNWKTRQKISTGGPLVVCF